MKRALTIMALMGIVYMAIEVSFSALVELKWRLVGSSSLWMMLVGGTLGISLGSFNESKEGSSVPYKLRVFLGMFTITAIELISGCILNLWCKFDIWDYSRAPLNLLGQIDIIHSTCWLLLTPFVFWSDDVLRHYLYEEAKPLSLGAYYARAFLPGRKETDKITVT